ncbi:MAG: CBS domain-containing protein, partial [Oscillospiraceae bacterium]|nr:CBS domain-containing protein [Oscillospiraceae bacterium]
YVLGEARQGGSFVFLSNLNTLELLERIKSRDDARPEGSDSSAKWMRTPPCLYFNDFVSDWYDNFGQLHGMHSRCAVIDDDLRVCGTVYTERIMSSPPQTKISSLYKKGEEPPTVELDTDMLGIADYMIENDSSVVFVVDKGVLSGVITANDLLRYYRYTERRDEAADDGTLITQDIGAKSSTYLYRSGAANLSNRRLGVLNTVLNRFCSERNIGNYCFSMGSFYFSDYCDDASVMISCEQKNTTQGSFILDINIYTKDATVAQCMVTVNIIGGSGTEH